MKPTCLFIRLHPTQGEDEVCVVECDQPDDVPVVAGTIGHCVVNSDAVIADVSQEPFPEPLRHRIGHIPCSQWMAMVA